MQLGAAREAARDWVRRHAGPHDGFLGAYFSGSTVGLSDDADLPPTSDVDVTIVTSTQSPRLELGKLLHNGALLEVSHLAVEKIADPETVLSTYHLAGSFRADSILCDPTGHLGCLQEQVSRSFAERRWVLRRCANARQRIESYISGSDPLDPWHDQVTAWLFAAGVTTHVLLVAALRNPTVRLRYLAVRDVLRRYGMVDLYEELLRLLGCADLSRQRVEQHLTNLESTFDTACSVARTPFFFSSDITPAARHIAIDGSRDLVRAGDHREAVFWILATYARGHKILAVDASRRAQYALTPAFDDLLADLGITSTNDLQRCQRSVTGFLPALWEAAEQIVAANPDVVETALA